MPLRTAPLTVGYLPLVKGSWINPGLETRRREALQALCALDARIVEGGRLIQSETEAEEELHRFEEARVDLVVAHFLTFSLGSIVPGFAVRLRKPLLLWSEPEPPMTGGRIAANSFCASNMNAHALWKMRLPYAFVYGAAPEALPQITRRLRVHACLKRLQNARIGSLGGRVPGFYTSNCDELALRAKFGVEIEGVTLLELVRHAETLPEGDLARSRAELLEGCRCEVPEEEVRKGAALLAAWHALTASYRLDAWTARCWPEFAALHGIGVCHLLGCMTRSGVPVACEGDVYGALAMLIVTLLSGSDAFFCDLISFEERGDTGLFWHCGAAPTSLCRGDCTPVLRKHSIIDGGDRKGLAVDFPLKPGPVTVLRIGETRDGTGFRMLLIRGEALATDQLLHGTPLTVRFQRPARELAETLVASGFEHHYVLCHGDIAPELRELADLLELERTEL